MMLALANSIVSGGAATMGSYPAISSLATIGDSLTSEGSGLLLGGGHNWWHGDWTGHLRTALEHRITSPINEETGRYTFAVSGAQADGFLAGGAQRDEFLAALASDADTVAVFLGRNDISNGRSAADTADDVIALWDEILAADKAVLAFELIGVTADSPVAAAFRAKQVAVNALLRSAAATRRIQIIRWGDLLDEDGDGFSETKYVYDTIHTTLLGGTLLANYAAARILSRVTGDTLLEIPVQNAGAWATPNAHPTGTPGSNQTATGWTIEPAGNVSVAKNLIARTDGVSGCWQEIVASGAVDAAVLLETPTDFVQVSLFATGSFSAGDRVRALVEYELVDPMYSWHLEMHVGSLQGADHFHSGGLGVTEEKIAAHSGFLWTEPWDWTAETFAMARLKFFGNGTIRLGRMGVYKVGPEGFNPLAYANLTGWFDASDSNTLFDATSGGSPVAADGAVARWVNKVGRGESLIQGTSGSRPVRKAAAVNGLDVLRFDGVDDFLTAASFGAANSAGCFIAAFRDTKASSRSYQTPMSYGSAGASMGAATTDYNYGIGKPGSFPPVATQAVAANTTTVVAVRWNGTAAAVFVNGVKTTATLASGFAGAAAFYLGQHNSAGISWFGGDIEECFVFNDDPEDATILEFNDYLTDKWT